MIDFGDGREERMDAAEMLTELQSKRLPKANPPLPGALIEREKKCDLCDTWTTVPHDCEIKGSAYTLCPSCVEDNAWQITDALAKADAGGAEEDAAQEEPC